MNTKELTKTYSMIFSLAALHLTKQKANKPSDLIEQIAFECIKLLKNPMTPSLKEIISINRTFEKKSKPIISLQRFNTVAVNNAHSSSNEMTL
jgi:hypothetical protein